MVLRTDPPEHPLAAGEATGEALDPTRTGKAVRLGSGFPQDASGAVGSP